LHAHLGVHAASHALILRINKRQKISEARVQSSATSGEHKRKNQTYHAHATLHAHSLSLHVLTLQAKRLSTARTFELGKP
jgi:hypothetical protein